MQQEKNATRVANVEKITFEEFIRKLPYEFVDEVKNGIVSDAVHKALQAVNKKYFEGVLDSLTDDELREEVKKQVVEALSTGRYTNELFKSFKPSNYIVSEQTAKWIKRYNKMQLYLGRLMGILSEMEMDDFAPNTDKLENELMQFWKNYERILLTGLSMSVNEVRGFEDCPEWLI